MNIYYTYVYLDPRKPGIYKYVLSNNENITFNYEPFYIGKGKKNRDKYHLYLRTSNKTHNKHLTSKIRKIINETNQNPIIIRQLDNVIEQKALDLEIKLITAIGRHDLNTGSLCNHSDGGESNSNKVITNKARIHNGVFKKGQIPWNKDKTGYCVHTEEHKKNLAIKLIGVKRTDVEIMLMSKSKGGTPILQYDLNGVFIKEWSHQRACRTNGFSSIDTALKTIIILVMVIYG